MACKSGEVWSKISQMFVILFKYLYCILNLLGEWVDCGESSKKKA